MSYSYVAICHLRNIFRIGDFGMRFQRNGDDYGRLLSVIPWIRYIFPDKSGYNEFKEVNDYIYKYFEGIVDRLIATYDENHERNVIDLYVKEKS